MIELPKNLLFLIIHVILFSLNILNYVHQYLLVGQKTKTTNYLITLTIYLLFDQLLTILHFLQNGFIFVCVSLIL